MHRDTDRADARTAATVRNAKGFVQIEMANIRPDVTGTTKANLGIHVRAVHVNLAAVVVHDVADFANGGFENSMRRGIRYHECGEDFAVRVGLGAEINEVDVAVLEATHRDNAKASHDGAGGIGAMGGGGNETNVTMRFAAGSVVPADGKQAGVFTL